MFEIEISSVDGSEILEIESAVENASEVVDGVVENASANEECVFSKSGFENLPEDASLTDRAVYGAKITFIGMLTVFLVLIILWAVCALLGKVLGGAGKSEEKKPEPQNVPNDEPVVANPVTPAAVDYSMVAVVASAAIASYRGEDTVNFEIASIRPLVSGAVALPPETVAQIAATIACLEGKDEIDFTISSIRVM
jgi:sodium pump decarboxylase gamma subunit